VVAANPGAQPAYCYEKAADILVSYEGDAVCYVTGGPSNTPTNPPSGIPAACSTGLNAQGQETYYFYVTPQNNGWPAYADPNKFWNLLYDVSPYNILTTMDAIKQNNVGYTYITSYTLAQNPYGTIAYDPFWEDEQTDAAPVNASSTGPTAVTNLTTPVISYTTATIEWSLSSSPNGVVGYDIYQSGVSENGGRMWSVPQPTGQNTAWVDLDGLLQPNTAYTFTVVARDAAGLQSTASNPVTFTTAASTQSPPSAPGSLQATATTYTTTTLSWQPSTGALTVVAYDIYENGSKILTLTESINNGPATSTTIIGLTPGTAYTFNVRARDWQGNTSTASNVAVTPPALPGGSAISSPTAAYTSANGLVTYSANFLVPFSNHRVFIWSGNPNNVNGQNCYWAGFSPTQLCTDYLIQDDGSLWVYTGGSSQQYLWAPLSPNVQPTFTDPTNSNAYTWQIPFSSLAGGVVANTQVMFDADGSYTPTYSGIIATTAN
jgi:Fibronectin type III domain